jgi:hypothetical protein
MKNLLLLLMLLGCFDALAMETAREFDPGEQFTVEDALPRGGHPEVMRCVHSYTALTPSELARALEACRPHVNEV